MIFQFKRIQLLKANIESVWDFVSSPSNLSKITPSYMLFKITSDNATDKMYPGMIISYKVAPILNVKMHWVTEIKQVVKHKYFVDEQRVGPYSMWHHQHFFEETSEGVLMKDIITYKPPFGIIGVIANSIIINRKLNSIFDYRFKVMNQKFNQF